MNNRANIKDLKNKIRPQETKTAFSVTKEVLSLYSEIGKSIPRQRHESTELQAVLDTLKKNADLGPETIRKVEEKLGLTFTSQKGGTSNVCMVNSPEVRDEYKDTFDTKDLLDYMYAVLHSPGYREKHKDLTKTDLFQVPYPNDQTCFWKLAGLGAQLRRLHLLESSTVEKYINEIKTILKKIAETKIEESP